MNTRLLSALEREREAGFRNLSGTHLDLTVPVTERLANVLLASALEGSQLNGLTVTLRGGDLVGVAFVRPVFGLAARVALELRVRGTADLASDPRIYLAVARPSMAWNAISGIAAAAGLAPAGVEIGRDGVAVDVGRLAARAGFEDVVRLVRSITFDGEPGALRVHVTVEVPDGGIGPRESGAASAGASRTAARRAWPEPRAILPELRGARLRGQIAATDALVNEAIDLVRDGAAGVSGATAGGSGGAAPGPEHGAGVLFDAATLARWVKGARVGFEAGRVVLEADVVAD